MDFAAGVRRIVPVMEAPSSSLAVSAALGQDIMWQTSMRGSVSMESGPYPERPGEPDCAYYLWTGLCRFGMTCRYNHPPDRNLAIASARIKGEYPERVGQTECQHYLKTGTCKFGPTCKFHHPRDMAGIAGRVQLNILGYPLRPNERECAYYLRTGECKFGNTCKFHHPQPSNPVVPLRGSPTYPSVPSSSSSGPHSFIASTRWQGPSSYAQLILPQGLVQIPNWNTYPGQLVSVSSSESRQQSPGNAQLYGTPRQGESSSGAQGTSSPYPFQRENAFPERPDQPECLYYVKTGDCKFGASCKFHHPRERSIPAPNCVLSPLGFPLRPGEPPCQFHSRYGTCKFGASCKFDHPMATAPMGLYAYGFPTPASSANTPIARRLSGSSSGHTFQLPESRQTASDPEG